MTFTRPASLVKSEKICGIYAIRRIGTDKAYVGQSIDCYGRYYDHRKALKNGKHDSQPLQRAWAKYSDGAFEFVILEDGFDPRDKETLTEREQFWIDQIGYYNIRPAAGSNAGIKFSKQALENMSAGQKRRTSWAKPPLSEEQKARLRILRLGKPSPWKGKSPSNETRSKMSIARKGKPSGRAGIPHTEETRRKMSAVKIGVRWWYTPDGATYRAREKRAQNDLPGRADIKGRTASAETKSKMSEAHSGEKNHFFGKKHSKDTREKMSIAARGRSRTSRAQSN